MNTEKIVTFCRVVDRGGFAKAADDLYCSEAAVSKQIRSLENELGYPLFDRAGKKVALNESGRIVYRYGQHMLLEMDEMKQELVRLNCANSHAVSFGATNYIGVYIMPPHLRAIKDAFPDIAISFTIDFLGNILKMLMDGRISFAFIPESAPAMSGGQLTSIRFMTDEMVLVFPPDHPLAGKERIDPEMLVPYPFLVSQPMSATRQFIERQLKSAGVVLPHMQNMYNTETIKQAILSDMGISILSRRSVSSELTQKLLRATPVAGLDLNRGLYLVYRKDVKLSKEDRLFIRTFYPGYSG